MNIKSLIEKGVIIFYQRDNNRYISKEDYKNIVLFPSDDVQKKYSKSYLDFHPDQDPLLNDLKSLLDPKPNKMSLFEILKYKMQSLIRKFSDPSKDIFKTNKADNESYRKAIENDLKNMKNGDEILRKRKEATKRFIMNKTGKRVASRSFIFKQSWPIRH